MASRLGFVLVTYDRPAQTLHLCRRLNVLFDEPPIAIHHDFSQCSLDNAEFPRNVRFVERWTRTGWGSLSVVDAQLEAIRLLYRTADPDWFTTLSSTDYPIKTAEYIDDFLAAHAETDAFLDTRPIHDPGQRFVNEGLGELAFRHPRYHQVAYNRYVAFPLLRPALARRLKQPCEAWVWRSKLLASQVTPFSRGIRCYAGDFWLTANRRVAHALTQETPLWRKLHHHLRKRACPEEAFYHSLLGNTPGLRLTPDNLRYTDWRGCYAHPRTLGRDDFSAILASTHHFARKFADDFEVLQELDAAVAAAYGNPGSAGSSGSAKGSNSLPGRQSEKQGAQPVSAFQQDYLAVEDEAGDVGDWLAMA